MDDSPTFGEQEPISEISSRLELLVHDVSLDVLKAVANDPRLTEDLALVLLKRRDLPPEILEQLHKHKSLASARRAQLAIVMHPGTPRHVSVPAIRQLYSFELMKVTLSPSVLPDVKRAAEEVLITKIATVSPGECFSLAKQGSGRVAAVLLLSKEERTVQAALSNPRMTEAYVVKGLRSGHSTEQLARTVCYHQKWSYCIEVKAALVANRYTPFARMAQFATELPLKMLKDILHDLRLPPNVKAHLQSVLQKRTAGTRS